MHPDQDLEATYMHEQEDGVVVHFAPDSEDGWFNLCHLAVVIGQKHANQAATINQKRKNFRRFTLSDNE